MTRKASDSPMRVTERYLVSLGSSSSSALYRSIVQTAELSPMCVCVFGRIWVPNLSSYRQKLLIVPVYRCLTIIPCHFFCNVIYTITLGTLLYQQLTVYISIAFMHNFQRKIKQVKVCLKIDILMSGSSLRVKLFLRSHKTEL